MDKVTVEDVFRPSRGWLSSILCIGKVHEPCRQSLFCVSVGRNSRWLGEGSDWAGWHIDTREGELSTWFHPDFQSLEPPVKGWQFWHGGKYRNSVLLLQSVVDGQVVPLHKAVLRLCALSLLRLTLNSAGPPGTRSTCLGKTCQWRQCLCRVCLGADIVVSRACRKRSRPSSRKRALL